MIGHDGEQIGVVPIEDARQRAEELALDLVEVGPNADPPVVKILDWGKMKFERDKKARESKKKTQTIEIKEVKYRPTIDGHDFDIKTKRAERFLREAKKVKVTIFFRYRQLRRPELGVSILDRVTKDLSEIADVEHRSGLEGRQMTMVLGPKPQTIKASKSATKPVAKAVAKTAAKPPTAAPAEVTADLAAEVTVGVAAEVVAKPAARSKSKKVVAAEGDEPKPGARVARAVQAPV